MDMGRRLRKRCGRTKRRAKIGADRFLGKDARRLPDMDAAAAKKKILPLSSIN
jgi:hypothetical protein